MGSGNTVALEITWEGTHSGDLLAHTGTIAATGRRVTVKAMEMFEVENGKWKSARNYLDLACMLAQLGVGAPATA